MAVNPLDHAYSTIFESQNLEPLRRQFSPNDAVDVTIEGENFAPDFNAATGAINIEQDNGDVVINFPGAYNGPKDMDVDDFEENLAETLDQSELSRIAENLCEGIEQDIQDRSKKIADISQGIKLLAMEVEDPRSGGAGDTSSPVEGTARVRNPMLQQAVLDFQATARGELLPTEGPVKIVNINSETIREDRLASLLERDMNAYLTKGAPEYYPDTDKLLFFVGFAGLGFKKVYYDPIDRRPVSRSVRIEDLIVPASATDLVTASRKTHRITMQPHIFKKLQRDGFYLDIDLGQPEPQPDQVKAAIANTQGTTVNSQRPEDTPYVLYECYTYLDLHEDVDDDGEETGVPLPYRVTIDSTSKRILEIRRNWKPDGPKTKERRRFVKYPFVPALDFYDLGLLNILGNATAAMTMAWRIMLDAGSFNNFPGFIYNKNAFKRQDQNSFRIPPGGGVGVDAGINGKVTDAISPLPYKGIDASFMQLVQHIEQMSQRAAGAANQAIGEGKQDAPVGTTLALLEQAAKVMGAVHKRLHTAQSEEFQILKELFKEYPESLFDNIEHGSFPQDRDQLLEALNRYNLVPVADPNVPSNMHRHAKVASLVQLVQLYPAAFNLPTVLDVVLRDMKWDNPAELLAPPQPPQAQPPDPKLLAIQQKAQSDQQKSQLTMAQMAFKAQEAAKERKSKEDIEILKAATAQVIHPFSADLASNPALPPQIQRPTP